MNARGCSLVAVLAAMVCSTLALTASPALALEERLLLGHFDGEGGGAQKFGDPNGMAVDEANSVVYVADLAHDVVDKFNLKGEPLNFGVTGNNALSGSASPAASFAFPGASPESTPAALAVDNAPLSPSRGDLYVLDAGHGVIDKFAPSGEYLGQLKETPGGPFNREGTFGGPYGVATDTSGDVWVFEPNGTIDEFSQAGTFDSNYTTECQFPSPVFAINSVHDAFISCEGVFEEVAPGGTHLASVPQSGLTAITVDLGNDHFVVAQMSATAFEYDATLTHLEAFLIEGNPSTEAGGLALDSSSGDLYMSNPVTGLVYHWGAVITLPDVETGAVSNVGTTTATAAGTVNPDGIEVTTCEFEYGTTTEYGKKAPCSTEPGSGSSEAPVIAELEQLEPDTLYHYRLTASNAEGTNPGGDQTFTTAGVPTVDEESASGVSQTTATIEAEINPHRFDTTYHFEYGESTAYGTSIPIPDEDIGSGSIDQRLSAEIPGLRSGVTYHYRVVATNSKGVTDGFDKSLTTVPPAEISGVSASNVSSESATLNATIDPLGRDTTYQFEYGTSAAYGRVAPAVSVDIGAGTSAVEVSQAISELQPNTPYHFRVVAKNDLGTASSADHVFVYDTAAEGLPDGRAYEMVTPPQKNGARIGQAFLTLAPTIARSGSRAILPSLQCFGDTQACNALRGLQPGEPYAFTRTSEGWSAAGLSPSAGQFDGVASASYRTNADLGTVLFSLPPAAGREDHWYRRTESGAVEDIGPITPPEGGAQGPPTLGASDIAATADLSHVIYTLNHPQNKAFELWPFDSTVRGTTSLYEYSGSARQAPELVAVSGGPASTNLVSTCGAILGSESPGAGFNVMSADGETVFFMALAHPEQSHEPCVGPHADELYARVDRSETVPISRRSPVDCTSEACLKSPPANAAFQGASEDGKRALFTSTQQLTDNASEDSTPGDSSEADGGGGGHCFETIDRNGCNLYMYDFEAPAGENLIDVSAGDTSGLGPQVKGVVAVSSDASHVYFVAGGVLTQAPNGQGEQAVPGADNLYLYERNAQHPGGRMVYIATLSSQGEQEEQEWRNGPGSPANVTPDGRFLVFLSHAALTADDTRPEGPAQVYRYDAESGQLVRVSIGAHGFNDDGNAGTGDANIVSPHEVGDIVAGPSQPNPTMSDDGAYVFFESPVGLTRGALNDVVIGSNPDGSPSHAMNIYEYHDGEVSLISDGHDTSIFERSSAGAEKLSGVLLLGSDASGANVLFITADQLVPEDTDTQFDVYDARIGGGFPAPVSPASCQGEACHGTPAATPSLLAPGTATFSGAGNLASTPTTAVKPKPKAKPARCRKGSVRKHNRCVKAKTKRKRAKARKAANDRKAKR